ncbi:MAG: copper amine oxidase N-terminal domain-containing protein [Bacillota bacterium]
MQRKWLSAVGSGLTLLVLLTGSALAQEAPLLVQAESRQVQVATTAHGEILMLEGRVMLNPDGSYGVDGRVLRGNDALYRQLLGQWVWVLGRHEGDSTSLKVRVERIERAVAFNRLLPRAVTVNGLPVSFDQLPYMQKGTLMLPLRALAEAAGGTVEWRADEQSARVFLENRTATFTVGQPKADLQLHNALMQESLIPMDQQVVLQGGRMVISADALTNLLGMAEEVTSDPTLLALRHPMGEFEVPEPLDLSFHLSWSGTTLQVTGKAGLPDLHFEILLDGRVVAQSDAQVKDGYYETNILVEGGAFQQGILQLVISDPATGKVLVTTPTNNHHR